MAKIYAQHPDPEKQGTNIDKEKYDQMHEAIVVAFMQQENMVFKDLVLAVKSQLAGEFKGSIEWYVTVVKLDMEAKGEMRCDRSKSPNLLSLS
ncbi:unnamed protein product [Laminaria digitata]